MGKGGSSGGSTTTNEIPAEYKALSAQTGTNISNLQNEDPISQYLPANPTKIAPLSDTQNQSLGMLNQNLSDARNTSLENSPIVQAGHNYFEHSIAPGITNQATLSGLGRSTANTNALAAAEAQTALPLLQGEQSRRDQLVNQGMTQGDVQRSVSQQANNADQQDFIRRQALAEQGLFSPLGQLPSTLGQSTVSKTSGGSGGMSVICTELHRQGIMDDATFEADTKFGDSLPRSVIRGYHLWAAPIAKAMAKSKLLTWLMTPIAMGWANEMRRRVTGEGDGSLMGFLLLKLGVPICGWLGKRQRGNYGTVG